MTSFPRYRGRAVPVHAGRALVLAAAVFLASPLTHADCKLELELIGRDLKGVRLAEATKLQFAPVLDDAIKRCRIGRESAAMAYFARARKIAGIEIKPDDLDTALPAR
ncbi:MAG: hypothetical protein U1F52_10555 [Burkholderiales bacterium]